MIEAAIAGNLVQKVGEAGAVLMENLLPGQAGKDDVEQSATFPEEISCRRNRHLPVTGAYVQAGIFPVLLFERVALIPEKEGPLRVVRGAQLVDEGSEVYDKVVKLLKEVDGVVIADAALRESIEEEGARSCEFNRFIEG